MFKFFMEYFSKNCVFIESFLKSSFVQEIKNKNPFLKEFTPNFPLGVISARLNTSIPPKWGF